MEQPISEPIQDSPSRRGPNEALSAAETGVEAAVITDGVKEDALLNVADVHPLPP